MLALKRPFARIAQTAVRLAACTTQTRFIIRAFATPSAKTAEQIDIDKKNGALAYVPSASGFEMNPISGIFCISSLIARQRRGNQQGKTRDGEEGNGSEQRSKRTTPFSQIAFEKTIGTGRERSGPCGSKVPSDAFRSGENRPGCCAASRASAFSRVVRSAHKCHPGRAVEHQARHSYTS